MIETLTLIDEIKNDIPGTIYIDIDWDVNVGHFRERVENEGDNFLIAYDLYINALSGRDRGDYITPPSMWIKRQIINVTNIEVFDKDADEVPLTEEELIRLERTITNSISIN